MRNFRAIACALGALLISSALSAGDMMGSDTETRLKALEGTVQRLSSAKEGGAGLKMGLPFTIDGFVDVTGNYNFNKGPSRINRNRHYDQNADTFTMNVAHFCFHKEAAHGSLIGFKAEVDFGSDAQHNNASKIPAPSVNEIVDLQEATITLLIPNHEECSLVFGKFATFEGIELIETTGNPVISRGLLFMFAEPLTHVGGFAEYKHDLSGSLLDIRLGAVNGWDLEADNNMGKTLVWLLGLSKDKSFDVHLNGTWGDEQASIATHRDGHPRNSVDLTGSVTMQDLVVNFQVNGGSEKFAVAGAKWVHWFGFGIQPVWTISSMPGWSLAGRFEVFNDVDGARLNGLSTNEPAEYFNITVCPAYALAKNCTVRGEYRYDWSNLNRGTGSRAYEDKKGSSNLDHQSTFMLEIFYTFSTEASN